MTGDGTRPPVSRAELVALLAMLTATVAFSIDAMLPVIPDIGGALSPADPNRAQLVIAGFVLGLGIGTFVAGPLSDAYGRRRVAATGVVIYTLAALLAALAPSLETLLIARLVQGLGAAGPRIAAMAIVRDLFSGREMARIMSFIIFVFSLAPVVAPSVGAAIAWAVGWRAIFAAFALFSAISIGWLLLRLPETLAAARRRPFRPRKLAEGTAEILSNRQVVRALIVQTLIFACLFSVLMSSQQVFDVTFGRGASFPAWFALMAVLAAMANLLNARVVMRLGMRRVVLCALAAEAALTLLFVVLDRGGALGGALGFPAAFLWMVSVFWLAGFGIGNVNVIMLEPMGHMAGLAASIVTALATIGSAALAAPVGLAFDGTLGPLTLGVLGFTVVALLLVRGVRDGEAAG